MDLLLAAPEILVKVMWSAAIVLGLAAIAERVGTRLAGILSGAPQNTVLLYFFVGRDLGVDHVTASVPYGIASFTAAIAFVLAYYLGSSRAARYSVLAGTLSGLAAFTVVSLALSAVSFTIVGATVLTSCVIGLSIWLFRRIELVTVENPVRYTFKLLLLRGGLAAGFIVGAITLAEALDSRWVGLLAAFPAILLPTLLIIHVTYGVASTHAMIRNFPIGIGSIILYILSVPVTFPRWGVAGGTAVSLAIAMLYLAAVALFGGKSRAQPAHSDRSTGGRA